MNYETIKTHHIGDYRIDIYRDTNAQCPCTDWDMGAVHLFRYVGCDCLSDQCNWQEVYGKYGTSHNTLKDTLIQLVEDYVDNEDLVKYFQDGRVSECILEYNGNDDVWEFKLYNRRTKQYDDEQCFSDAYELYDNAIDLINGVDMQNSELVELLNAIGKDIYVYEWSSQGYVQGDYTKGFSFITKERYKKCVAPVTGDWKDKARTIIEAEVKTIEKWMWGDVIGYDLFHQVFFTKHYYDENREDEEDYEWDPVASCGGYYEDVDELIQLVIDEYELDK